jgi:histone-lysine N-methyltransferase ASH1L
VFSQNSTQQCLCGSVNCRGVLGPRPKERQSKAKQLAGAVKGAMRGAKRKLQDLFARDEDSEDGPSTPKKRSRTGPKDLVSKLSRQISSAMADAVAAPDPGAAQLNKDLRAKRAAERAAREEFERIAKEKENSPAVEKPVKAKKKERRTSTTISVSDLPRPSPRKARRSVLSVSPRRSSVSPAKKVASMKNRVTNTLKAAVSLTPAPRSNSQTSLLKSSSSTSVVGQKSARQSRLSFGPTGFGLKMSPKRHDEIADASGSISKAPAIPKRNSSLKAGTTNARPNTAKSLAKGASKVVATVKLGMQGDSAIRKTIRAVSGTE